MPRPKRIRSRHLSRLIVALVLGGLVLLAAGVVVLAVNRPKPALAPLAMAPQASVSTAAEPASNTVAPAWDTTPTPPPATATPVPVPAPVAKPKPKPKPAAPPASKVEAYRGLGSWVDIYDDEAFDDPKGTIADMDKHGVKTLYIETGNSRSKGTLFKEDKLSEFISEAHARDMKVVAWYLPDLKDLDKDYTRVKAAIEFKTSSGQKFDSFALDIESGAVTPQSARNKALLKLSKQIREHTGDSYPLGAIIPSPVGLSKKGGYWPDFPYTELAGMYDVFVPMGYYTYHGDGATLAYSDTIGNAKILRSKKGCSEVAIHMIGGISEKSSTGEVEAFVRGSNDAGCVGASLYGWAGTKSAHWQELKNVR